MYIIALPFFGIISEIIPVFSPQADLRLHRPWSAATIAITGLSVTVWAHHMFVTGAVLLPVLLASSRSSSPYRPA
ncbi:cytochrome c oxidase subunit I [Streptomyces tanashiensis]